MAADERAADPRRGPAWPEWAAPAVSAAAALVAALAAGVTHPPGTFTKYLALAAAPAAEAAHRALDVSPAYLAFVRVLLPFGPRGVLAAQVVLHAILTAAVAASAGRLAARHGRHAPGIALASGLLAATYPPLLVHAGIHEPEMLLAACLALAIAAGVFARADDLPPAARLVLAGAAGVLLGVAGLVRPQHLGLVAVWAPWMAATVPPGRRLRQALVPVLAMVVVAAPVVVARSRLAGTPTIMNPGVVAYEGNWPAATGLARHAPALVRTLEAAHPEEPDYAHVAYRRIASHALGRSVTAAEANAWWTHLALEGLRAHPGLALARFARKACFALMPHEVADLKVAEDLAVRLRARIPWGFGVLLVALPILPLARGRDLARLAGPLAVVALAWAVQVAFYASARQRLPLAVGLLVAAPVLVDAAWRNELRIRARPWAVLLLGVALAALLASATGRVADEDDLAWQGVGIAPREGFIESVAAVFDGRALRPGAERHEDALFAGGVEELRAGRSLPPGFEALAGRGLDFTVDDRTIGVPEWWLAHAATDPAERQRLIQAAWAVRPQEPRVEVAARLAAGNLPPDWRPAGTDPVSAQWIVATLTRRSDLLDPLLADFPELAPTSAPPGR